MFLHADLVLFLQTQQDVHSISVLTSLAELSSLFHFRNDFRIGFKDHNGQNLLVDNLLAVWTFLLLIDYNPLGGKGVLSHEARHLLLLELSLLHVYWLHLETLSSHYLLLLLMIKTHVLLIHHSGLHVKELAVNVRIRHHLHMLRGTLVVLSLVSLRLLHTIVLEHSILVNRMLHLAMHR